jgi:drug/metabolite transporter (DMT)-like permease
MALEVLQPAVLVSMRYIVSGSVLLIIAFLAKAHLPSGKDLLLTALFGIIIIGVGNGCLAFAEVWVPSGLAALFITTSPFWMIGLEAIIPGGERLHAPTLLGLFVGLAGTLLLIAPSAMQQGFSGPLMRGFLVLQIGCAGWSLGSILQRRHQTKTHPVVSGAVQQLATGLAFLGPALFTKTQPIHWTFRGAAAIAYLIVFGSIVGYSAYIYVLDKLPVSVVSIYNYVNPVVAVALGWLFYREHVGLRELAAMLIVFAGVALVKRASSATRKRQTPSGPPPASRDVDEPHTVA